MKLSIRRKLLIFIAGFNLLVSGFLAYSIYTTSYNLFFKSFLKSKQNFAEVIAKSIDGDIHKNLDSISDKTSPEYLRMQKYLNKIRQSDSTITYLYTVNYNEEEDDFNYCLYADYATDNIIWFETNEFAFEIHFDSLNNNYILYEQNTFYDNLKIKLDNYSVNVDVKTENNKQIIYIDNIKYIEIINFEPFTIQIDSLILDSISRYFEKELLFGEKLLNTYTSFTYKGEPQSNPGDIFEETEENIEIYRNILLSGKDYIDKDFTESTYGSAITAYGIIRDSDDKPIGLACVDLYEKEMSDFKKSISRISILISIISLLLIIIILPFLLEKLVVSKIKKLNWGINKISEKDLDTKIIINSKDEFQNVAEGFNKMTAKLKAFYENLEDMVRQRTATIEQQKEELNSQADNLREINNILNEQNDVLKQQKEEILSQKDNLEKAYDEISAQKDEIQKSNQQITSSITYAKRIQLAVLQTHETLNNYFSDSFIVFMPRDIVSGDFYFYKKLNDSIIIVAADCTGHGVPGAFMSILSITLINEIIIHNQTFNSAQILCELRIQIKQALQQTGKKDEQQDGMDIAFCKINQKTLEMSYAGANSPCWIFRNELRVNSEEFKVENEKELLTFNYKLLTLDADRQPIGIYLKEKSFTEKIYQLQENDLIYLFSDGYESQFGSEKNEKFKKIRFKRLLSEICQLPMNEQKQILENKFTEWKRNFDQTDDVLVVGVKI